MKRGPIDCATPRARGSVRPTRAYAANTRGAVRSDAPVVLAPKNPPRARVAPDGAAVAAGAVRRQRAKGRG
jgi:hypothetical protein